MGGFVRKVPTLGSALSTPIFPVDGFLGSARRDLQDAFNFSWILKFDENSFFFVLYSTFTLSFARRCFYLLIYIFTSDLSYKIPVIIDRGESEVHVCEG